MLQMVTELLAAKRDYDRERGDKATRCRLLYDAIVSAGGKPPTVPRFPELVAKPLALPLTAINNALKILELHIYYTELDAARGPRSAAVLRISDWDLIELGSCGRIRSSIQGAGGDKEVLRGSRCR